MTPSTISRLLTQYDNLQCYLLYLVWRPVEEQQNKEADHYYLTRTYLLPAYMADWILLSK
jgi:hypothetical protein